MPTAPIRVLKTFKDIRTWWTHRCTILKILHENRNYHKTQINDSVSFDFFLRFRTNDWRLKTFFYSWTSINLFSCFLVFQLAVNCTRDQTESLADIQVRLQRILGKRRWLRLDFWRKSWVAVVLCCRKGKKTRRLSQVAMLTIYDVMLLKSQISIPIYFFIKIHNISLNFLIYRFFIFRDKNTIVIYFIVSYISILWRHIGTAPLKTISNFSINFISTTISNPLITFHYTFISFLQTRNINLFIRNVLNNIFLLS